LNNEILPRTGRCRPMCVRLGAPHRASRKGQDQRGIGIIQDKKGASWISLAEKT
jgi:hypothetical protein